MAGIDRLLCIFVSLRLQSRHVVRIEKSPTGSYALQQPPTDCADESGALSFDGKCARYVTLFAICQGVQHRCNNSAISEALAKRRSSLYKEPSTQITVWGPTLRSRDGAAVTTHLWTESADRFEQVKVEKRRYEAAKDGQIIESELHTMTLRWYFKYEMLMMLEQAGFRDIFIYGNYTESAATAASSETVYSAKR
jgi:hypothetical protein